MKKTYKRLVKWFLSIVRADQELMIEATHSFETGNCLWTQLNPHSFVIFNDYFGVSIGFQLGLLSAPMQVSPSCKGSKCNVPLSSGKWKAWKASASALSAAGWDQLALKQPWENPACSTAAQCQEILWRWAILAFVLRRSLILSSDGSLI